MHNISRFLILANPGKRGMAQVIVWCPFRKFYLYDWLRFEPDAVFHFFSSKRPLGASPGVTYCFDDQSAEEISP
jgi:hypothetical protein